MIEKNIAEFEETLKSIEETKSSLDKKVYDGTRDILKYFDRIHDKLFTFNNIMIVGFFTISKINIDVPIKLILIPLLNLCFLIYIEFRMMEKSRTEANIFNLTIKEIENHGKLINKTNYISLLSIFTTLIVLIFFLFNLFK